MAVASVLWTSNMEATSDALKGLIRMFIFGTYFAVRFSSQERIKILAWVYLTASVLSLVIGLVVPSSGISNPSGWMGIFNYKNYAGFHMVMAATLFLLINIQEKRDRQLNKLLIWIGLFASVSLIFLVKSSTTLIAFFVSVSLLTLYFFVKQKYKLKTIYIFTAIILLLSLIGLLIVNFEAILVDVLGEGVSMNGRTPIWDLVIYQGMKKPWLGYGLSAFWPSDAGMYVQLNTWGRLREVQFNSHNSFLDFFVELGFVGLGIFILSFISSFVKTIILLFSTRKIEFLWYLEYLVLLIIFSSADSDFILSPGTALSSLYAFISISIAIKWDNFMGKQNKNSIMINRLSN